MVTWGTPILGNPMSSCIFAGVHVEHLQGKHRLNEVPWHLRSFPFAGIGEALALSAVHLP